MVKRPLTGDTPSDSFLGSVKPFSFHYKDPNDGLSSDPSKNHGKFLGIIAQRVQADPSGFGKQMVLQTPKGLAIDMKPALSALLGGVGRLHERADNHEGHLTGLLGAHNALKHQLDEHAKMIAGIHKILAEKLGNPKGR